MNTNIYSELKARTGGNIYIGVVGPVRCGKSTFITSFMNNFVIENIQNKFDKQRTIDELPQSADGKTVMTTQPKFIPNEAVAITINDTIKFNVRMVDCVGYMIAGALGDMENEKQRLVKTPWSEEEMPFEKAAEIGTSKVIDEHSTIAILLTTDGSVTDIDRASYVPAEEKIVQRLKQNNKPFVIVVNSKKPTSKEATELTKSLQSKYDCPAVSVDALNLEENDITRILEEVMTQFPLMTINIKLPQWINALEFNNPIIQEIINEISSVADGKDKIGDFSGENIAFMDSDKFDPITVSSINMGDGTITFEVVPKPELFYEVLSNELGLEIKDDFNLISQLKRLSEANREYDKIKDALQSVNDTGYGVVYPSFDQMVLDEPQIVKQGSSSGVKLTATAPSLHIMKVDVQTELNPIVGTQQQSEALSQSLLNQFEQDPKGIWDTNMFGRSLSSLIQDGINNKLISMPIDVGQKMRKTMGRVVNEGKGGIICILL